MREENTLRANINATFGIKSEIAFTRFTVTGRNANAVPEGELFELAQTISLFILSTLEF